MKLPELDKNSTQDEIENAIRSMEVGDYLQLTGDRGSFIATEYSTDNDHFLNLNEVSFSGKEDLLYVDGRVKSLKDIERAFLMYKNGDGGLAEAFNWKGEDKPFVSNSLFIDLPSDSSDGDIDESMSKLFVHTGNANDVTLQGGRDTFIQCISDTGQYLVILKEITQSGVIETSADVKVSERASITQAFLHFRHGDPELWNDLSWLNGPDGKDTGALRLEEIQRAVTDFFVTEDAVRSEVDVNKRAYSPPSHIVWKYGDVFPKIICPLCATVGMVHTKRTKKKVGISGAKATGAILTLGWSMLATGLSRKEMATAAYCANCEAEWEL